jgi:hypothetical protein
MDADEIITNPPAEINEELLVLIRRNINQIKKSIAAQDINRAVDISKELVKHLDIAESQKIHDTLHKETDE